MAATDAFVVCPEHGDLWWIPGARSDEVVDTRRFEPVIEGLKQPQMTDEMNCPLCGARVRFDVRRTVVTV